MVRAALRILAAAAAGLTFACAKAAIPEPPDADRDLIVLLPDPGSHTVGHAMVENAAGHVALTSPRQATSVTVGEPPRPPQVLPQSDVDRVFGPALAALPPEPLSFTLYFQFDSEELTADSRKLAARVLTLVRARTRPEVAVFGHTDTTGARDRNIELGLKRANAVRKLLIDTGVDAAAITVASHGEAELLVRTADGVFEPRNRRVEVTVR